jgi:FkbH-like protein
MDIADFLFPRDLQVTPTGLRKVLFIGSCLSEIYVRQLKRRGTDVVYDYEPFHHVCELPHRTPEEIGDYDLQYIQIPLQSVLTDAVVRIADNDAAADPLDWIDLGKRRMERLLDAAMCYSADSGIITFVSNFMVPQGRIAPTLREHDSDADLVQVVREINRHLSTTLRRYPHAYIADVDMILNSLGKRYFLDDVTYLFMHGAAFYPDWITGTQIPLEANHPRVKELLELNSTYENKNKEFFDAVYRQIEAMYRTVKQLDAIKLVIFDLDNTLWRGQLIDDYQSGKESLMRDGWPTGIWETVQHLRRRGITVSISSKNDAQVVRDKWPDVVDASFVRYEDFVSPLINWQPKAENIQTLLETLSLTPKSALLVDDSAVERESVKASLPGIRVIGANIQVVRRILLWAPETQISARTTATLQREETLRRRIDFQHDASIMSRREFLNSLSSTIKVEVLNGMESRSFTRVFELVNKTNQFNTTGKRWMLEDYRQHFAKGGQIFALSVADKFANYGTVGVAFRLKNVISQFVLSCRVLGMGIEIAAVSKFVAIMRDDEARDIYASMIETGMNVACRDVFAKSGFTRSNAREYILPDLISPVTVENVNIESVP